jgi:drug/metabolite transporter (DMT)-like permease
MADPARRPGLAGNVVLLVGILLIVAGVLIFIFRSGAGGKLLGLLIVLVGVVLVVVNRLRRREVGRVR